MTVAELIEQLQAMEQTAIVRIEQCYETSRKSNVTGLLFDFEEVILTDEAR